MLTEYLSYCRHHAKHFTRVNALNLHTQKKKNLSRYSYCPHLTYEETESGTDQGSYTRSHGGLRMGAWRKFVSLGISELGLNLPCSATTNQESPVALRAQV